MATTNLQGKHIAIVACWFLGNGYLFSWNSIMTIEDYYSYLFPKHHSSRVLTLVYQPIALGTVAVLAYNEAKINTRRRNLFGDILFFISALSVLVLNLATSGKGGLGPFIGICIICVADDHVHGGMVGDLFFMQPVLIQSFLAGLGTSGTLSSALRLITKAVFENTRDGLRKGARPIPYPLLFLFPFIYLADEDPKQLERLSNKELLHQNIDYALDVFLLYALTLSIFPGFLSENTGSHSLDSFFLKCLRLESRKGLMIAVLSQFLLIPAFYYTAKYGDQGWMIMLTSFLGLTNGYLTVRVLTSAPKGYKGPEQNALGNLLVLFLVGGTTAGVTLDWLWLIGEGW
ncbi:equilibrative nucleotide transporter 3-like isoform X2 [Fagus crenata]